MKKYSKQRELILQSLRNRADHPTVEMLYNDLKVQMPKIGIATVYRNLSELCENGDIIKIKSNVGLDRFDGKLKEHIHFECNECHEIYDIEIEEPQTKKIENEIKRLSENIGAQSSNTKIYIYGLCKKCLKLANLDIKINGKKCK